MQLRRSVFPLVLALVSASAALAACTTTAESRAPSPDWRPCAENAQVECATIAVPVDWSDPGGPTIDMAVARKRTQEPGRIGTLIHLPGGPGTSGVDELLNDDRFSPELHRRFDIVTLDPRGVKRSHPVRCDIGLASARPNLEPDTGARFSEVISYARDLADSCRQYTGPLFDHLDGVSVARDVDALRNALGENTVSLYGPSYGTMSGQAYLELFPQRVRAMVLDSVDDHSLNGPEFLASEARAAGDSFAGFVSWCDRETSCALHGKDVPALFDALYERAVRGELSGPDGTALGPLALSRFALGYLEEPEWSRLAADLNELSNRPPTPVTEPVPQRRGQPVQAPELIACSDWPSGIRDQAQWERLWVEQKQNAGTLRSHFAWVAGSICSGWPPPPNAPHRPRITDAPTVLLMNSRHDPATPYEWAIGVAANTPRSVLLTYDGWGHGVYRRNACTRGAADRYLIELTAPQPNTVCSMGS
ncbi:alpha/beta hydrolase [Nocardia mexicana]|uniref:Alpha/beta hydrolase family protein n=1 Tax=Nocardia mexicana TaxID=279262 RepID=A0A370H526_9NOCA|nr:alpha/beta hydrolase [Nocardia mexicana]RDI49136.1 alpha/beta hydrolase family protein [Nocardia mexicana]